MLPPAFYSMRLDRRRADPAADLISDLVHRADDIDRAIMLDGVFGHFLK